MDSTTAEEHQVLPLNINRDIIFKVMEFLDQHSDKVNFMLVNKQWAVHAAEALYHSPPLQTSDSFEKLMAILTTPLPYFNYPLMITKLDISSIAADNLFMGDLDAALALCPNVILFRIENCYHMSNILVQSLSDHCKNLLQLELSGCPISDTFIPSLAKNCDSLSRLDLSFTNITLLSLHHIISNSKNLVSLDLSQCRDVDYSRNGLDFSLKGLCKSLTYLNLRNSTVNDEMLTFVAMNCPKLETLILDTCVNITDKSIIQIFKNCPSLTRLDCSFCEKLTDASLIALVEEVKDSKLELLGLSACDFITPQAIAKVATECKQLNHLMLDGCGRILGTFVQECATHKDDLECTLERDAILTLASQADSKLASPPASPDREAKGENEPELKVEVTFAKGETPFFEKNESSDDAKPVMESPTKETSTENSIGINSPPITPPRILSKRSSMLLRNQRSLADFGSVPTIDEQARHERREKIREKRLSRSTFNATESLIDGSSFDLKKSENSKPRLSKRYSTSLLIGNRRSASVSDNRHGVNVPSPLQPHSQRTQGWNQMSVSKESWLPVVKQDIPSSWNSPPQTFSSESTSRFNKRSTVIGLPSSFNPPRITRYSEETEASPPDGDAPPPVVLASGRAARRAARASANSSKDTSSTEAPSTSPPKKSGPEPEASVSLASGRRRRPQSTVAPTTSTPSASETPLTESRKEIGDWQSKPKNAPVHHQPTPVLPDQPSNVTPPLSKWGEAPPLWTNPAQMTSSSSTWSAPQQPMQQKFNDPWALPGGAQNGGLPVKKEPVSSDPWAAAPSGSQMPKPGGWGSAPMHTAPPQVKPFIPPPSQGQVSGFRTAAGPGWQPQNQGQHMQQQQQQQPPQKPVFVFSGTNRGRMLLKLKIETKNGGHQTLDVHENDDAQSLAREFCGFWQMGAFKEPLIRLISVRKSNALRQRGITSSH